ncbi:MAG: branched chain amino acid aminotransferase [Archangium gephyra]|uniref:branched-chain-amino-acid transaminase n=1 Tax=Archangium gephyra TaxID=48 RepID=A0A2W5T3L3_9BACT|nr:MAG: branched chain amino acid aminotransferase [Archangium gephyra]
MDIRITKTSSPKVKPPDAELGFGKFFSDHLFAMDFTDQKGWFDARIEPYAPFQMDPAAGVFHYGQAMFEGSKAFRGADGRIRMFRPEMHAKRMAIGAPRLCMTAPSEADMMEAVRALVKVEADWVPKSAGTSLYLRPTLIATEGFLGVRPSKMYRYFVIASPAGNYFGGSGLKSVRIWVETNDVRAPRGGLGSTKAGANYAASLSSAMKAKKEGFDQVLWLDGKDHEYVEEVGTMNVCFIIGKTLVTPPLSDSILAGVTRDSVLTMARELGLTVEERPISIKEIKAAHQAGLLTEVFGTGTAAVISPVGELAFAGEKLIINGGVPGPIGQSLYAEIGAIQRGTKPDTYNWLVDID